MKNLRNITASLLFLCGFSICDLTSLNVNPDKPTDDVNYNMNEPRYESTLRGGIIIE